MNSIGQRIRSLRKKNDLTQEKLADLLGVTYQSVSKWECGVTAPDLAMIGPLTRLLHVTSDELLGLTQTVVNARREELEEACRKAWIDGGCLASEMETAALFTVSATLGIRSGAVLRAVWNQERVNMGIIDADDNDELSAARCAVEAMKILINK